MIVNFPKSRAAKIEKFLAEGDFSEPDNKKLHAQVEAFCAKYKIGVQTQEGIYCLACHVRAQKEVQKEVIRKQAQDGMDSLIDPLLESTKELIRILESRPTRAAPDASPERKSHNRASH